MTERLSLDRFRDLADAYGGVVARWPELYREAAMRLARDPEASAILRQASALDEMLDAWHVPAASPAFRDRLIRNAPVRASLADRAKLWWSGVGIAAALAGAAAGTAAVAAVAPVDAALESSTSFGDVSGQES